MSKAGTDTLDKSEAWDRLERLLSKAKNVGSDEDFTEQDAMKLAVQSVKDVRRGVS